MWGGGALALNWHQAFGITMQTINEPLEKILLQYRIKSNTCGGYEMIPVIVYPLIGVPGGAFDPESSPPQVLESPGHEMVHEVEVWRLVKSLRHR